MLLAAAAAAIGVRLSVGRTGSCHDNAVAESFFSMLKNERVFQTSYATRDEARADITGYIEAFYNRQRPHSAIGYQCPADCMESFFARTAAADVKRPEGPLAA